MNHTNKYPDDIKKAHDDLMVKIETVKSKKQDEAILNRINGGLNNYVLLMINMLLHRPIHQKI